jgi:hypothetical protein
MQVLHYHHYPAITLHETNAIITVPRIDLGDTTVASGIIILFSKLGTYGLRAASALIKKSSHDRGNLATRPFVLTATGQLAI